MKKKRLIPILLLKNGWLVQSRQFKRHQNLGNPITAVRRLSQWGSDELIYLDISRDDNYDIRRDDQGYKNRDSFLDIIKDISMLGSGFYGIRSENALLQFVSLLTTIA